MPRKWIFVDFQSGDRWVLPIWNAYHKAVARNRVPKLDREFGNLGLQISIRLNMLPRVARRLRERTETLFEAARRNQTPEHISSEEHEGVALAIDPELLYETLVDIDSFLFEVNSACELLTTFSGQIWKRIGLDIQGERVGGEIRKILTGAKQDTQWFIDLDGARNFFIHEGAPFMAVDVSAREYDLLIMRENLDSFQDSRKFVRLSQLDQIASGFGAAKTVLRDHLTEQLDSLN